jgi:ABC-type polysaccharide/polyol phosphate transport system ATPase subunit
MDGSSRQERKRAPGADAPLAIRAEGVEKAFRIPTHRVDSLKERVVRPFAARDYRELRALDGISFDVRKGEFFGIVGRNGSGKSTLLKILASIYRADAGRIEMAGRLAPFIELGVGFNPELTARENVVLNGVMMGLTPRETKGRLDAVVDFAELGEFVDLKIKNYSSGMLVRLAFSTMLEADADVLLIDEVLAVGDVSFQQKCTDAFHRMKGEGTTIVLVTHDMASVEEFCHRAMLIGDGVIQEIGDPGAIGRRYMRLNFETGGGTSAESTTTGGEDVRLVEAWFEDDRGARVTTFEEGEAIHICATLEPQAAQTGIMVGFILANADGIQIFEYGSEVENSDGSTELAAGSRVSVRSRLRNQLTPGHYFVHCGVNRVNGSNGAALYVHNAADFVIYGSDRSRALLLMDHEIEASVE